MAGQPPDNRGPILFMVLLAIAGFIAVAGGLSDTSQGRPDPSKPATTPADPSEQPSQRPKPRRDKPKEPRPDNPAPSADDAVSTAITGLPGGGTRVFADGRCLVAYYGTARTRSLGVLGEAGPAQLHERVMRAARPLRCAGERIQPVLRADRQHRRSSSRLRHPAARSSRRMG